MNFIVYFRIKSFEERMSFVILFLKIKNWFNIIKMYRIYLEMKRNLKYFKYYYF